MGPSTLENYPGNNYYQTMLWEKEGGYEIVLKIISIYCANTIDGNLSRESTDVLTNLSVVTNSIKISMDRQKTFADIIFFPREMLNWLCTVQRSRYSLAIRTAPDLADSSPWHIWTMNLHTYILIKLMPGRVNIIEHDWLNIQ